MPDFTWLPANQAAREDVEAVFATGGAHKCRCQALKVPGWIWRDTTQEQRDFIYFLFGRLGWLDNMNRVSGFLRKYAGVERVEDLPDRKRAIAIIEALKAMVRRQDEKSKELCEVG